jgi:hypothetical protein
MSPAGASRPHPRAQTNLDSSVPPNRYCPNCPTGRLALGERTASAVYIGRQGLELDKLTVDDIKGRRLASWAADDTGELTVW